MAEPTKAVFLSYAREDAGAARRIADALRSQGIEVWFDESELRGGDAWDAKIRKQINDCALFLPIISQHTQERGKGYFRLEWRLAVEQTHLMAEGMVFLAPVVVDDTPEGGALVPPEFMRVQWTRLPGALATPQFVEQVKRLLSKEQGATVGRDRRIPPTAGVAGSGDPALQKKAIPPAVWISLGVVAVSVGVVFFVTGRREPKEEATRPSAPPVPVAAPSAPAPRLADKSIAVLPFTNMSEDKDNAFFADGVHEDVLTNLALIRELRVVSRTSVQSYRGTAKPIRQIAEELGVTFVLEGSVRRVGNKVRVTGQLIHAGTDEHIWAATYDRDLTDIFAIQTELSRQIAAALKTALSPEEQTLIARRPTTVPAAYDKFLQARDVVNREGNSVAARTRQLALLEEAVALDPNFAQAWGDLAAARAFWSFSGYEGGNDQLAQAKKDIERAMQLAPDDPAVFGSLGTYYYYGYRDYVRAAEQYERRAQLQPNAPVVFNSLALIQRRQGRWAQSLVNSRRACELDPANTTYLRVLYATLRAGRRWEEMKATQSRIVALLPDRLGERYNLAEIGFLATGSRREVEAFFAEMSPAQRESPEVIELRKFWAAFTGDYAEAARLDRIQPYYDGDGTPRYEQAYNAAFSLYALGDKEAARQRLGNFPAELRAQLQREPGSQRLWGFLAMMEVVLGHKDEALRAHARVQELVPESRDALDGATAAALWAWNLDLLGEKEKALAEYARVLRTPCIWGGNVHEMGSRRFSTLLGDPRFEALLNDPKNNQPLF